MGKMFIYGGATPPTENPHVGPQRDRLPHWSILISRSGALPRTGRVTTHRELTLIRGTLPSFQALKVEFLCARKGNPLDVAEAPWDSALREDWSDTHATDDVCSAGMVDIDCYLLNRGLQLDSTHVNHFILAQIVRKGSTTTSSLTESSVQLFILDFY